MAHVLTLAGLFLLLASAVLGDEPKQPQLITKDGGLILITSANTKVLYRKVLWVCRTRARLPCCLGGPLTELAPRF